MSTEPLTCQQLVEIVTDYFEEKLSPEERARFDAHVAVCPGCGTYVEQMQQTIRTLGQLPPESIPEDAQEQLLRAFREWKRG